MKSKQKAAGGMGIRAATLGLSLVLAGCYAPTHNRADFEFVIDPAVEPLVAELAGLSGGPSRPVGVVVTPDGARLDFVENEVIFRPDDAAHLATFLARYNGVVLRDGKPQLLPDVSVSDEASAGSGLYLIQVDLQRSALDDLPANMTSSGDRGSHVFSSDSAARLAALLAREAQNGDFGVAPNLVMTPQAIEEHPNGAGGFLDAETQRWMTEDDDPAIPGDQGASIGVARAWRYLRYKGLPPEGTWEPPVIAIIDDGFDLDDAGNPISAAPDFFPSRPLQVDLRDFDLSAGGPNLSPCSGGGACPWHGQTVFGVAAAMRSNRFGGAGTGSNFAWPLLLRIDGSFYLAIDAIRSAYLNGADVIVTAFSGECDSLKVFCTLPPDDPFTLTTNAVLFATTGGTVVVAAAGNEGASLDGTSKIPCKTQNVLCVGGIDVSLMNRFNFGAAVDIWAPGEDVLSTVTPANIDLPGINPVCCNQGTSISAPFVAGVVALMKALNPALSVSQVKSILQQTANPSPDPRLAGKGYLDAFRAVEAVNPNGMPTVTINIPSDGITVSHNREIYLHADVADPESPNEFYGKVEFRSDRDGFLCESSGYATGCQGPNLSLGTHVLSATAKDPFGASAIDSIEVESINQAPIARITYPGTGASFFEDQTLNFRGYGFDWDQLITDADLTWTSSIDGNLATGGDVLVSLSPGDHTMTLTATDASGLQGQESIAVAIQPGLGHPSALITSPSNNANFADGTVLITFEGTGSDPQDGNLTGASLSWASNIDGPLGTGQIITTTLSGAADSCDPLITHTVTLTVTDSDGNTATHAINVRIGFVC